MVKSIILNIGDPDVSFSYYYVSLSFTRQYCGDRLKLPTFWPAGPNLWFAQVDAQFCTKRITSQATKFEHVIATLAPQYAAEVRDLILKPLTLTLMIVSKRS